MNISDRFVFHIQRIFDFNEPGREIQDFRKTVIEAVSDTSYAQDLIFDLRTGILYHKHNEFMGGQGDGYEDEIDNMLIAVSQKVEILREFGLIDVFTKSYLVDICGKSSAAVRELGINDDIFIREFVVRAGKVGRGVMGSALEDLIAAALIADISVGKLRELGNFQDKTILGLKKLTNREELFDLLSTTGKRRVLSDDFSL